jgi:hypothetical protein
MHRASDAKPCKYLHGTGQQLRLPQFRRSASCPFACEIVQRPLQSMSLIGREAENQGID